MTLPGARWPAALTLFVLSPLGAEYLVGYDASAGRPLALLAGLLILAPLYGGPALIVREVARRRNLGWPGVLVLASAAGLLQAGVVDQSLFAREYGDIPYWTAMTAPTWIEPLGFGVGNLIGFVVGHLVWSFALPVALAEAAHPGVASERWLHRWVIVVVTLLWAAAAGLVLVDLRSATSDPAGGVQVAVALAVVLLLIGLALRLPHPRPALGDGRVAPVPVVAGAALSAGLVVNLLDGSWTATGVVVAVLATGAVLLARVGRHRAWDRRHVLALCAGLLLARAGTGFLAEPVGPASASAVAVHHTVFALAAVLGPWWLSARGSGVRRAASVRPG